MTCLISRATTINDDAKIVNTEKYMSAKIHFQGNLVWITLNNYKNRNNVKVESYDLFKAVLLTREIIQELIYVMWKWYINMKPCKSQCLLFACWSYRSKLDFYDVLILG